MIFLRKCTSSVPDIRIPIRKAGSRDFATSSDWTPAAGDVKLSIYPTSVGNVTYLPTYSNGFWTFVVAGLYWTFSNTTTITVIDSAPKAVEDTIIVIESFGPGTNGDRQLDYGNAATAGLSKLASIYHADIQWVRDQANTRDEYLVTWYRDGLRVTSGVTSSTLRFYSRSDGSEIGAVSPTEIGSTHHFKRDEATYRLTLGETLIVSAEATIDGATRKDTRLMTRDSVQSV